MPVSKTHADVVVAGHICLDIIPILSPHEGDLNTLFVPGTLLNVGPAVISTGGVVSNTGLALHRLGISTQLTGKIGADLFGHVVLDILRKHDDKLAHNMKVSESENTSYTIVINPPNVDRMFFHYPGTNDTFRADDVDVDRVAGSKIFHFGYPPIMRQMYLENGAELCALFQKVKATGIITSLDMSSPDPESEAGQVDWKALLNGVLPSVDIFLPSLDEILFMLAPQHADGQKEQKQEVQDDGTVLSSIAGQLLDIGGAIVVLKLGDQGLYIRTTADAGRLTRMGAHAPQDLTNWIGRELLTPCFKANMVGTTGSGDCTIAGFLAGFLKGQSIEEAISSAVAVGAFNVESADATSGIPDWDTVQERIQAGWDRLDIHLTLQDWRWDCEKGLWYGPEDKGVQIL